MNLRQVDKTEKVNHETRSYPAKNQEFFQKEKSNLIASSLETLLFEEDRNSPEQSEKSELVFNCDFGPDILHKFCDQCNECQDCCCRSLGDFQPCEIFPNVSDKKSPSKAETRNNTPSLNEALIADDFDDLDENNSELAVNEGYKLERDDVCTRLAPFKSEWMFDVYPNPDSDRDSGCFSEEQNLVEGVSRPGVASPSRLNCLTECHVVTPPSGERRPTAARLATICKPVHSRYQAARPFHRKIWKRRNGWYKVRREATLAPSSPPRPANYAAPHSLQLRSQLSGPSLEFLRDTAAKECQTGREKENITFEQELSDNDPDTEDTIESDAERLTSPCSSLYSGECVADLLSNMRLEIARMVAESAEASAMDNPDEAESEQSEWSRSEEEDFSSEPEDDILLLADSAQ